MFVPQIKSFNHTHRGPPETHHRHQMTYPNWHETSNPLTSPWPRMVGTTKAVGAVVMHRQGRPVDNGRVQQRFAQDKGALAS